MWSLAVLNRPPVVPPTCDKLTGGRDRRVVLLPQASSVLGCPMPAGPLVQLAGFLASTNTPRNGWTHLFSQALVSRFWGSRVTVGVGRCVNDMSLYVL